ncbi:MAG: hypothetical protein IKU28_06815 [Erysipelotrichaceae bacterium]|nr:hypothetical protein [Erysipelotrichaceae bacterium]
MANKKESGIDMDDVLKAAKKFVKQGKLDELAEAWVENNEKAENPNQLTNLLSQVGQFIKDNDVEDKLEDLLNEGTKTTKKSTSKKSTSTKKSSTSKKTTAKKSTTKKSTTKKSTSTKKSTTKKSTSTKKTATTKKSSTKKSTTKKSK